MNKLGWILFIVAVVAIISFWKRPKTALVTIAPKQCMFHVDDNWSRSFQEAIIHSITDCYESSKNPDTVISKMTTDFPEIGSVQAQVCSSDKICFHVDGVQPVFLLNDMHVVGTTGHMSNKDDFSEEVRCTLPSLVSQQLDELPQMVHFVQKLSPEITSSHTMTWQSVDTIVLSSRDIPEMQCVTCTSRVPLAADVQRCHELYQELLASQKTKKTLSSGLTRGSSNKNALKHMMVYDIRFKNQIIVRPGG